VRTRCVRGRAGAFAPATRMCAHACARSSDSSARREYPFSSLVSALPLEVARSDAFVLLATLASPRMQMADEAESEDEYESGRYCLIVPLTISFALPPREPLRARIAMRGYVEMTLTTTISCFCLSPSFSPSLASLFGTALHVPSFRTNRPIVIDNGTGRIKAGFADDEAPKVPLFRAHAVAQQSFASFNLSRSHAEAMD